MGDVIGNCCFRDNGIFGDSLVRPQLANDGTRCREQHADTNTPSEADQSEYNILAEELQPAVV
jgi:hypothetical protein